MDPSTLGRFVASLSPLGLSLLVIGLLLMLIAFLGRRARVSAHGGANSVVVAGNATGPIVRGNVSGGVHIDDNAAPAAAAPSPSRWPTVLNVLGGMSSIMGLAMALWDKL